MQNIINLKKLIASLNKKAALIKKNNSTVGALRGVMVSSSAVRIGTKTYTAIAATNVQTQAGTQVWCQLASSSVAVIIGG